MKVKLYTTLDGVLDMLSREIGWVTDIVYEDGEHQVLNVNVGERKFKAMNFTVFSGKCAEGDKVLLNTTAIRLNLGTGGYHFVIANLTKCTQINQDRGHIMKLRYTPLQIPVQSIEEQGSLYHDAINAFKSLDRMPIIIGTLHSMIAPALAMIRYLNPQLRLTYIMTDGASLPLPMSRAIRELKEKKILDSTITYGHAFGGDYETVNIYTAIIGAKEIAKADIAMVAMGPGIVGTGTKYGFTGIEQGTIIDAVNTLGGIPIAIPRISFADKRTRHYGLSHHSKTILGRISKTKAIVSIPKLQDNMKKDFIDRQLKESRININHHVRYVPAEEIKDILNHYNIQVSSMGRSYDEDPIFFQSAASAGKVALEVLRRESY